MSNPLLTIVIPTYNHPDSILFCLKQLEYIREENILLAIHDSSDNDEIQKIVSKIHNENILYFRYDCSIDVDLKTLLAIKKVTTKYLFLCGDGVVMKKEFYKKLKPVLFENPTVVECYDWAIKRHSKYYKSLTTESIIEYRSPLEHFSDNFWHMPYYGGSVVKTEVFAEYNDLDLKKVQNSGFIYPYTIYLYAYHHQSQFKALVMCEDSIILNPYKKDSGWLKKKLGPNVWVDNFSYVVKSLPHYYDAEKSNVLKTFGKRSTFFTTKGLLNWRAMDNYNFSIYKKYSKKIIEMSNMNRPQLFVISITPKCLLLALRKIIKKLRGVL